MTHLNLSIDKVVIAYTSKSVAVQGVSLELRPGTITALLGPSGSGKSSLLRSIAGLERLQSGTITYGDTLWSSQKKHVAPELRRCGVVFQDYALFPHLTALKNVMFGVAAGSNSDRRALAQAQLETVELGHKASSYPHELSGGEQQRVAVARALATNPSLVLLDEAFSGLDRRLRGELRDATARAVKSAGAATLIVTHDSEEALSLADDLALMHEGKIIQRGLPDALYLKPNSEVAARLLGPVEAFDARIENGVAQTEIGTFAAGTFHNGFQAKALIRPEGILIGENGEIDAEIVEKRISVGYARVFSRLSSGRVIGSHTRIDHPSASGDAVKLRVDPKFVSVVDG